MFLLLLLIHFDNFKFPLACNGKHEIGIYLVADILAKKSEMFIEWSVFLMSMLIHFGCCDNLKFPKTYNGKMKIGFN